MEIKACDSYCCFSCWEYYLNSMECCYCRQLQNKSLELLEANKQISVLEEEIVEQAKEVQLLF